MICNLRNLFLISAAAAVSAANGPAPKAHQLDDSYTFEQYLSHFEKSYDDPAEYGRRSAIFANNMNKILSHNVGKMTAEGNVIEGYVMGVNKFTDVATNELPMGYNKAFHPAWSSQLRREGAVTSTERLLGTTDTITTSYSQPPAFDMKEVEDLPVSVDWTEEGNVNSVIPDQGACGSCWSFAATGTIESHLSIATAEEPFTLSEQNMLQCAPNPEQCGGTGGCGGSTAELAYNYIADLTTRQAGGMFDIADLPYNSITSAWVAECEDLTAENTTPSVGIRGWTMLESNDYKSVMNALAQVGPLAIAVAASGWMRYQKGVFDSSDATINHAVLLVGYGVDDVTDEKYYKVRNSWGPNFGEDGYIRLKRNETDSTSCNTDTQPLVGVACALDANGTTIDANSVQVCGTSGILFDVAYPVGVHHFARLP
eukprot:CAMPEP_0201659162 /NCGR_PEP_ID=MMETSP0494-20130426/2010_1 /ASSEMBLY_ACC=CAM_ASM_000839 /TAXON_ID=420259 /ORGANISM="Thalassiosira gravida, Strain GMp14c1" /LENGTH=426 /DNA_ID=CAMNT_0048136557 /DNA_START=31 /DNA_END=1311 /DNA_ORIENTATION=+